jgi:hypothetical protein
MEAIVFWLGWGVELRGKYRENSGLESFLAVFQHLLKIPAAAEFPCRSGAVVSPFQQQ